MPFYKSKNATISERLTGVSNEEGFKVARKQVQSGRMGLGQKAGDSWFRTESIKRNLLPVVTGIVGVLGSSAAVLAFLFK